MKTVALMSLGIPLATMPAVAQDDEGELTPVVITGSNIPTVELEGPSPIVRIDREEINRSGAESVQWRNSGVPSRYRNSPRYTRHSTTTSIKNAISTIAKPSDSAAPQLSPSGVSMRSDTYASLRSNTVNFPLTKPASTLRVPGSGGAPFARVPPLFPSSGA